MKMATQFAMETGAQREVTLTPISMATEALIVGTLPAAMEIGAATWMESRLVIDFPAGKIADPVDVASVHLFGVTVHRIAALFAAPTGEETVVGSSSEAILTRAALSGRTAATLVNQAC